jgi:menaquinone-specific isochorismate synthase
MVGEVPDPVAWQATVANTAADIRAGRFEKVVLARTLRLQAGSPFDAAGALRALRVAYPSAYVFAVASGARCFLGATPELLVRLTGRDVEATCLAGSIGRGATAEEDERLARRLLDSAKDQVEHRIVVRAIQGALAAVCDDLLVGAGPPRLLRVANVQHLYTPVRGRLAGDRSVLELVERPGLVRRAGRLGRPGGRGVRGRHPLRPAGGRRGDALRRLRHRGRLRPGRGVRGNRAEVPADAGGAGED